MRKQADKAQNIAYHNFVLGNNMVESHPVFAPLARSATILRYEDYSYPSDGLAYVTKSGYIICNRKRRAEPLEWARALAHCLLHLGLGHFVQKEQQIEWNIACDCVVEKFLNDLKFGKPFYDRFLPNGIKNEETLYQRILDNPNKAEIFRFGTAGVGVADMNFTYKPNYYSYRTTNWGQLFAKGLNNAIREAVKGAKREDSESLSFSAAERAKEWFISSYPLLGAIAANFRIIGDHSICERNKITVAAVSPLLSELYINPSYKLSFEELKFVMAHEFLHAALRHDARQEWRDAFLWNIACDFVVNGWLTEMGVGERPDVVLYDEKLKGQSAEAVYDLIVTDMRTYHKLATLRGVGLSDILGEPHGGTAEPGLDEFYRRALSQGLEYHQERSRGYIPASLIEEIHALSQPPIPWDVELARWFDDWFVPLERKHSYARASRRQSATPDIPRPNWVTNEAALDGRTFGVVLDTSGSMERHLLANALGAIASYSTARDVPAARVVFCDAQAYDVGYMKPEDIAGTVKVKGRGGTILQPGIDLLLDADDFPKDAPILIITDGICDKVILHGREHAFLIPRGTSLPFVAKGKVFRIR
jgi:predicted metal-dependent peptidase